MIKRIVSAVIGVILLSLIISSGGLLYLLSIMCMNIFALWELKNAFNKRNIYIFFILSILIIFSVYATYYCSKTNLNFLYLNLVLIVIATFLNIIINKGSENRFNDIAYSVFSFVYTTLFFIHFIFMRNLPNGKIYVWWTFVMTWACDTGAFFSGLLFGRKKLSPLISPNKTIEGSLGGIVSSMVCSVLFCKVFAPNIIISHAILLGSLIGIFSQLGDLSASLIKRFCNIKDFSNIIPGHGGILDRFDSSLFSFPVAYYYIVLIL